MVDEWIENDQRYEIGKQKGGGLVIRAACGFTESSLWWLRLCRPSTYHTRRNTNPTCDYGSLPPSISLPVSTRQSTHTAKSRGSRGWLKASGPSFLLLQHFPHARSPTRPQPGARSILVSLCFFSYSLPRTRFKSLSQSRLHKCTQCLWMCVVIAHLIYEVRGPIEGETVDTWEFDEA